jgi:hypothetical protein
MGLAAYSSAGTARSASAVPPAPDLGLTRPFLLRQSPRLWNWGKRPVAVLKIAPFWRSGKRTNAATVVPLDDSIGLDAFGSEATPIAAKLPSVPAPRDPSPRPSGKRPGANKKTLPNKNTLMIAGSAIVLVALAASAYALRNRPLPWAPKTGSVTFETVPGGVEVFVAQKSLGRSPVTVALAPGTYDVRLGSGPQAHAVKVAVTAGTSVVQHFEMAANPDAAPPTTGQLRIQTDPPNLPVVLDGVDKGVSPLTLEAVEAGDHEVAVRRDQTLIKRAVHVSAGEKMSVIISSTTTKPDANTVTAGWLSVTAPISLRVKEGGRLIGSSDVDKLMLSSGDHDLEFSNEGLGFRVTRRVNITAGKTTASSIAVPNGTVSLNALPWAEVYVDGNHVGQTPLGNVTLPIGTHEVVFRHPDLGERKETITVTATAPARLGVDLRKK